MRPLSGALTEPGCWRWIAQDAARGRAALFLDRDGVVVEEVNHLRRVEDVRLIAGAGETIAGFNRAGVPVILVTNQSGVARGYFDWTRFADIQQAIAAELARAGARLDAVLACGYHEDGRGPLAIGGHPWRKPAPGMILEAARRLELDLERSALVGDRAQDLQAARAAGLSLGVQVSTGHGAAPGEREAALALRRPGFRALLAADLADAAVTLQAHIAGPV